MAKQKKCRNFPLNNESGRSLVEMLGMLAIMGILSVTGIAMYRSAMNRYYANELINEAQRRAVIVAGQINMLGRAPGQLSEFTDNTFSGGTFATTVTTGGLYKQFGIQVSGVPKTVCENILGAIGDSTPLRRLSPTGVKESNLTTCTDTNTFLMIYNDDLAGKSSDTEYVSNDCGCQTVCGVCTMINEQATCVGECSASSGTCTQDTDCPGTCVGCVKEENAETGTCQACQRVEYLESTGTQWIDTEIIPTLNTGLSIDYAYSSNDGGSAGITGTYQGSSMGTLFVTTYSGDTNAAGRLGVYHRGGYYHSNSELKPTIGKRYSVNINWKNDGKITIDSTYTVSVGSQNISDAKLKLFGRYYNGSYSNTKARIYKAEYSEGAEVIANFIPVLDPQGVAAMFDKVSGTLFYNSGSGDNFKTDKDPPDPPKVLNSLTPRLRLPIAVKRSFR